MVAYAGNGLLYKSDAADDRISEDIGGGRIIKKKKKCYIINTLISITTTQSNSLLISIHATHLILLSVSVSDHFTSSY